MKTIFVGAFLFIIREESFYNPDLIKIFETYGQFR
jgi:hypothetical protein